MTDRDLPPYLTMEDIDTIVRRGLDEDVGPGDVTTMATIHAESKAKAFFLAKESGRLAGLRVVERVFSALPGPLSLEWAAKDGEPVSPGQILGRLTGNAQSILKGERLALNLLQRMSGIATQTRAMVDAARGQAGILDTRKTVPGLRLLDKWAVLLGGGTNHRVGLHDMILIKDNHIAASGGIPGAIEASRRFRTAQGAPGLQIEIEVRTLEELDEVLQLGGVDRVLLDNMAVRTSGGDVDVQLLKTAVQRIAGRFETEASGNVTIDSIGAIADTGVDFVSVGALTHSVRALDISLKVTVSAESYLDATQPDQ